VPVDDPARALPVRVDGIDHRLCVFDLGLACCAVEVMAALLPDADAVATLAPDHRGADVLIVSGTVTDVMAPAVRRVYEQLTGRRYVVSFGACASSGGPYWDSYAVTKGVDQLVPVDVWVPGCPPRPEALLDALRSLAERIAAESGAPR
jgi:NADH-quinone oxidoreductase subunit B